MLLKSGKQNKKRLRVLEQLLASLLLPSLPKSTAIPQSRGELICFTMEPWRWLGSWGSVTAGTELPQPAGGAMGSREQHLEPALRVLKEAGGGSRAKSLRYKSLLLPI